MSTKKLIYPKCLAQGDQLAIVAPAGPVDPDALKKGVAAIKRMGFEPVLGKYVQDKNGFLAGTDPQRADDLMGMFENSKIKAILCARGGYGVNRILPLLKPQTIRRNPKIVVGASDITLLLLFLYQKCSLVSFHGPMPAGSFGRHPMKKSRKQFCEIIMKKSDCLELTTRQAKIIRAGKATGPLTGGCLTLLCRSLRTPYEIQTQGHILLIEDVNERPYRIDGMLWQLKTAGKFKNVRGVVFGEMINCNPSKGENYTIRDTIAEFFKNADFPVLINCPIGHGKEMWTLPIGVAAELDAEAKSLTLKDYGVI